MLSYRDATVFFLNAQIGTFFLLRSGRSSSETSAPGLPHNYATSHVYCEWRCEHPLWLHCKRFKVVRFESCQRMIPASRHGQIKSIKQDIEDSKRIGYLWKFIQNLPGQRSKMFQIHVARFLSNRKRSRPSCRRVACHRDSTSISADPGWQQGGAR